MITVSVYLRRCSDHYRTNVNLDCLWNSILNDLSVKPLARGSLLATTDRMMYLAHRLGGFK